jgi:hypothetical protein
MISAKRITFFSQMYCCTKRTAVLYEKRDCDVQTEAHVHSLLFNAGHYCSQIIMDTAKGHA